MIPAIIGTTACVEEASKEQVWLPRRISYGFNVDGVGLLPSGCIFVITRYSGHRPHLPFLEGFFS